jgi:hypothetical protein
VASPDRWLAVSQLPLDDRDGTGKRIADRIPMIFKLRFFPHSSILQHQ